MAKQRFVVADPVVCESLGVPVIIMMADIEFWSSHYEALLDWCDQYNGKVLGMTVELPDAKTLTAFALRWS